MRILFIGCVESSEAFLGALLDSGADVVGVITRKRATFNSDFVDLSLMCKKHGIPYIYADDSDEVEMLKFVGCSKADIGYCFGWSRLISETMINAFPLGMVGYHPAALPNNRGRHPIIWALVLGLDKTASTFFKLTAEPDAGCILSQHEVEITYEDTSRTLMDKLLEVGKGQVLDITRDLENDRVEYVQQDLALGNSWRKRSKEDGRIDWRMSGLSIYNLVRALTRPYPGAHCVVGDEEIKVWKVRDVSTFAVADGNIEPGKIVDVRNGKHWVKVADGVIELTECDPIDLEIGTYLQ